MVELKLITLFLAINLYPRRKLTSLGVRKVVTIQYKLRVQ